MAGNGEKILDFDEREVVLRADFSRLDEDDCVLTSTRLVLQGPRRPREGEWVYLLDVDGRGCMGQVESLNGWSARVRPDWRSWVPAGELPPCAPAV